MTEKASPTLTVQNGEVSQDLFMSFGLLNRLTRLAGGVDQVPMLAVDVALQEAVILEVFTTRDAKGKATFTPESLDEVQVSLEEIALVLDFVGEHVTNFFAQTAEKAQARMLLTHERVLKMSNSMPTKPGS